MANPFDQFDELSELNPFDQFDEEQPSQPQKVGANQQVEPELTAMESVADAFTGESRITQEMEQMSEIGDAPELNELSWGAFKASLGLLATGDEEKAKDVIKSNIPSAEFTQDSLGNTVVNLPSGSYALNKPGVSGQDIARGVFDIAAFTPAGRAASIPAAVAKSAATEAALQGATSYVGGGDISGRDIALSGALGGAGKGVEGAISTAYRAIKGKPAESVEELIQFAQERNLPLTTTDVIQPETFTQKSAQALGEKIPVTGTSTMRRTQQEARQKTISDFTERFGEYNPQDVVNSLTRQQSRVKKAAGNMRNQITNTMKDVQIIDTSNAIDAIDNEIKRLTISPSGVPLKTVDDATVSKLAAYRDDLLADPSFESLERLRTNFRTDVKGERMTMPNRSEAAINNIYASMTKDMDQAVSSRMGSQGLRQWKKANAVFAKEADKLKNTRIKSILQKGELTPEVVNNMLYSNKPSEVKSLYQSLDIKGKKQARAGLISKAIEQSGDSPDKFLNNLNKMSKQTGITFNGEDKKFLDGMKDYLNATRRAGTAGVTTPTGQELFQIAAPVSVMGDIGATGGVGTGTAAMYGLIARAYESKPVRDVMTKLANTPKGSTDFEDYLSSVSSLLSSGAQALRRSDIDE